MNLLFRLFFNKCITHRAIYYKLSMLFLISLEIFILFESQISFFLHVYLLFLALLTFTWKKIFKSLKILHWLIIGSSLCQPIPLNDISLFSFIIISILQIHTKILSWRNQRVILNLILGITFLKRYKFGFKISFW